MDIRKIFTLVLLLAVALPTWAASAMEETMYRSGKIYTFLAVAMIVLAGMFFYLFRLDLKLARLEKELKEKERP